MKVVFHKNERKMMYSYDEVRDIETDVDLLYSLKVNEKYLRPIGYIRRGYIWMPVKSEENIIIGG